MYETHGWDGRVKVWDVPTNREKTTMVGVFTMGLVLYSIVALSVL